MKIKSIILFFVTIASAIVIADVSQTLKPRRRRPYRPSAGILERKDVIPSRQIDVIDLQKIFDKETLDAVVKTARFRSSLPLKLGKTKTQARIEIIESDQLPSITLFPDEFRAQINVKPFFADNPTKEVAVSRLRTQLTRAAFFIMGSGMVSYKSLTMPVRSLADLDSLVDAHPFAQEFMHLNAGKKIGVKTLTFCDYERACQEGWAPAPTNDIQKAIWDKVRSEKERGPTNPIEIPMPKKK
jgi:hypothetical protein